jgi:hypothetical protein
MTKLKAIEYLIENSKYNDEWSGAGMWEAVCYVMVTKKELNKRLLDKLLEDARNR